MAPINPFPVSASLTRRLGEAADGYRNIPQVFFVAAFSPPYNVIPFETLEAAKEYYDKKNFAPDRWAIYGPFKAENEIPVKFDMSAIETIEVIVKYKDGTKDSIDLDSRTDAAFFNLSSLDKFLIPYYTRLYGVDRAKIIRDELIEECKELTPTLIIYTHVRKTITVADEE
jgi:hypothetical protein